MSYDFESTNSNYGLCASPSAYPSAFGWSFAVWFKFESLPSLSVPMGFHAANNGQPLANLLVNSSGSVWVSRRMLAGIGVDITSGITLTTGTWYLAAYSETSRTARNLWINATQATTVSTDLGANWSSDEDLTRIGVGCEPQRDSDGGPFRTFDGLIAEAALWSNYSLTQTDVTNLYGGGTAAARASTINGGPTLGWWLDSDKGTSTYAADTGTGTLTLGNSPVYSSDHPTLGGAAGFPKTNRFSLLGVG